MPINVRFDKVGFYHPAFGRMGRGKNAGRVYTLPDFFATEGKLPASAEVIEDKTQLEEILEEEGQTKPIKPKVVDEVQLKRAEAQTPVRLWKATDARLCGRAASPAPRSKP